MTAPLRVLMTADVLGGVLVYAAELARALRTRGVEVLLATMGGELSRDDEAMLFGIEGLELEASRYRLEWMREPWDDVARAGDWLRRLSSRWAPDVVHLNGYAHGVLDLGAPKVVVAHSCVLSWWQAVHREPAPPRWARYAGIVRRGLQGADAIVAPTRVMLEAARGYYGPWRPEVVVRTIANGSSPAPAVPEDTQNRAPVIVSAGRLWDEAKNLALLEEAALEVAWPIHVAGPDVGPDTSADEVKARFRHVFALGRLVRSDLLGWFGRAAIYVHPAKYEPFGLTPLEAGLAGCALALADLDSLREVWGDDAVYFDPERASSLVRALGRLVERPSLRAAYAERARARAGTFTAERMASDYLGLYGELVSRVKS